jgi:hypothetical protein
MAAYPFSMNLKPWGKHALDRQIQLSSMGCLPTGRAMQPAGRPTIEQTPLGPGELHVSQLHSPRAELSPFPWLCRKKNRKTRIKMLL